MHLLFLHFENLWRQTIGNKSAYFTLRLHLSSLSPSHLTVYSRKQVQ